MAREGRMRSRANHGVGAQEFPARRDGKRHGLEVVPRVRIEAGDGLFQMQFARLAVEPHASPVVDPVGGVGALLDLGDEEAGGDRVHGSGGDHDDVAGGHRDLAENAQIACVQARDEFRGGKLEGDARVEERVGRRFEGRPSIRSWGPSRGLAWKGGPGRKSVSRASMSLTRSGKAPSAHPRRAPLSAAAASERRAYTDPSRMGIATAHDADLPAFAAMRAGRNLSAPARQRGAAPGAIDEERTRKEGDWTQGSGLSSR